MANNDELNNIMDSGDFRGSADKNPIQRIKVIGVGGGGNNAVIHMHRQGIQDVSFVLLNTDRQVLDAADVPTKVLIGPGRGAGGKPERARKYAEDSAAEIAQLFDDETDMVFITAGMGGGTGTGAGPVVARIAKERGILTVGIVTLPFMFEGERRVKTAIEGADEMARNVDSLLVINNQRLTEIYQNLDIFNAFAKADDTLLNAAQSITDIITNRGVINRDFNDVDTTLREGGTAIISTGYGEGPDRVTAAIQDALHSPLLKNTDIFGSRKLLMALYVSDDSENHPFNMEETRALDEFVHGIAADVDVMWGLYKQSGLDDKVRITILASGFEMEMDGDTGQPERAELIAGRNNERTKPEPKHKKSTDHVGIPHIQGKVLDPNSYDDPESEELKDMENRSAIDRNPYKQFGVGMGGSYFRGTSSFDNNKPAKSSSEEKPARKEENSNEGLFLDFDDFD